MGKQQKQYKFYRPDVKYTLDEHGNKVVKAGVMTCYCRPDHDERHAHVSKPARYNYPDAIEYAGTRYERTRNEDEIPWEEVEQWSTRKLLAKDFPIARFRSFKVKHRM